MLHPIRLPDAASHLDTLVEIQRGLLVALADPTLTPTDVTEAWVVAACPTLPPKTAKRLANTRDKVDGSGRPLADNARIIATLGSAVRHQILSDFDLDRDLADTYDEATPTKPLRGLAAVSGDNALAVRGLLSCFYDPQIYRGFLIEGFTRERYMEAWRAVNARVCPYCDSRGRYLQLDHYAPKSKYPSLSCHHENLVPACEGCNGRWKRNKDVFSADAADPIADWLHPLHRALSRHEGDRIRHRFVIEFVRGPNRRWEVRLSPKDGVTQPQIDNFSDLIGLADYWADETDDLLKWVQEGFAQHCDFEEIDAPSLSDLNEYLSRELAMVRLGRDGLGLLRKAYLLRAVGRAPDIYDDIVAACLDDGGVGVQPSG